MGRGVNSPEFLVQRGRIEGNPKYSQFRRPKVYTAGWTGQLLDDEFKEGLITRLCGCLPGSLTDRLACFFFFSHLSVAMPFNLLSKSCFHIPGGSWYKLLS
jgi:hypothetical protein